MNILAIETSCDDTGIAVLKTSKKSGFKVLSNIVSSQVEIHKKWGGVYPTLAKREHQKNLVPVLIKALKQSRMLKISNFSGCEADSPEGCFSISNFQKLKEILQREEKLYKNLEKFLNKYEKPNIDLIAVTNGPGLEPCLWVGINFAKALSFWWDIPIVPINHTESHILVNFIKMNNESGIMNYGLFPAVCLVVSGGHTQLILMKDVGKYKIVGETRDDAAGECFDKCAKILGLGYPGGPAIAKFASQWKSQKNCKLQTTNYKLNLPRPMFNTNDYDFSFSGLKTAVLYDYKKRPVKIRENKQYIQEMAYEIQRAIIDVLIKKTIRATRDFNAKTIILGGGVSANCELRSQFELKVKSQKLKVKLLFPPVNLSADNALMTAIAGYFRQKEKIGRISLPKLEAKANLRIEK